MTSEGSRLSHLAVWLCVGCAVIVTGLVLRREFTGDGVRIGPRGSIDYQPTPVENWEALVGGGRRVGSDSAIMTIVEFGDFQCPACKQFHERVLSPLMAQHPDEVALVFHHWPLPYHRHAYRAARMAECAADQGVFRGMMDVLYRWQDSLGADPSYFARLAQIPDTAAFGRCSSSTAPVSRVDQGMVLAEQVGGSGTPTLVINGRLLRYIPDSSGLAAMLEEA